MMKAIFLACLAIVGFTNAESCYKDVHNACTFLSQTKQDQEFQINECHAKYSAVKHVTADLQTYVMHHLLHSFQYLLMSTNFATYESNREGFAKLFRKLSDNTWDDAIDLIKYITKRGETMDFNIAVPEEPTNIFKGNYNMFEIESLSRALDMYKWLAIKAHKIHSHVSRPDHGKEEYHHDAETLSYVENKFVHKHADAIRELAGYSNDLASMILKKENPSLPLFLFDEYLQTQV